jgi:SHS2 domain-containing protein
LRFELLEHPADIGFRVFGGTPADLFANAAMAMLSIAAVAGRAAPRERYEIAAEGSDYESLLVNWLNEVLYFYDGRRIALCEFRVTAIDPTAIAAIAMGEPRDPERHPARLVVKAVTYHQLRVAEIPQGWVAEVYLDI